MNSIADEPTGCNPHDPTEAMILRKMGVLPALAEEIDDVEDELLAREARQIEAEARQRDQVRRAAASHWNGWLDANAGYWPKGME